MVSSGSQLTATSCRDISPAEADMRKMSAIPLAILMS